MNITRRHKIIAVGCVSALILLAAAVVLNSKKQTYDIGRTEKEGDLSLIPRDQLLREKLVVGVSGATGIPYLAAMDGDEIACNSIYEPLFSFDRNREILFAVADKMDINEEDGTYTFHIDESRRFSNGAPVTPEDIKRSYQLISDPSVESRYNASLSFIKGYNEFRKGSASEISGITTRDGSVTFHLESFSWNNMSVFNLPITNAAALDYEKGLARQIMDEKNFELLGTGVYTLSDVNSEGIELLRVDAKTEEFAQVLISPVGISSVIPLFKSGFLDLYAFDYNEKLLEEAEKVPRVSLYSYESSARPYIGINCRDGALSDVNVRKGLSFAIQNQVKKAHDQFAKAGYSLNAEGWLEKDSELLAPTLITYNAKKFTDESENIKAALAEAGVSCEIESFGLSTLREQIRNREFELYYTKIETGRFSSIYFDNNEIEGLEDENINRLKQEMAEAKDFKKFRRIYDALIKAYEDKVTRIALDGEKKYIMYSPRLQNINVDPYTNVFWGIKGYRKQM